VAPVAVVSSSEPLMPDGASLVAWPPADVRARRRTVPLVGREAELAVLDGALARALRGERQVVFVTGEPGAGKTALVEHFVADAARRVALASTGGQCLEHVCAAEPYMPVLEAIGRLAKDSRAVGHLLRRCAPTWLVQLPWLIDAGDRAQVERALLGAARERMLRELSELVEAVSAEVPLVLVLEDLHWSDPSTVDALSLLVTRREPTRLLVIGSYRPVDLILARHPLRAVSQALQASRPCQEIALDPLGAEAVADYLARRFPNSDVSRAAAGALCERTDGNPLFLVTLVEHLIARGAIVQRAGQWHAADTLRDELTSVPEGVRRLIEQQLQRLPADDRELLEAASLVGNEFSAAAAAAAAGRETADVETRCTRLVGRGPYLERLPPVRWPDGTMAEGFGFRHALYRQALETAVSRGRGSEIHLRVARVLEAAYGARAAEIAAELALHFEEGGDYGGAIRHRRAAAQTAARRFSFVETEAHLDRALALLETLPASAARDREEFVLQSMVARVRQATRGYGAPEVSAAFERALALSHGAREPSAFYVLNGICTFHLVRGELDRALELSVRNLAIAEASGDRLLLLVAHQALWAAHFFRGELAAALYHLDAGEPLHDPVLHRNAALRYGSDPKTAALAYRAVVTWVMGSVDRAMAVAQRGIEEARSLGHPLSLVRAMVFGAWLRRCRREPEPCRREAETAIAHCEEHALPFLMPHAVALRGWALGELGDVGAGTAELQRGRTLWQAIGSTNGRTLTDADLAAIHLRAGRVAEARRLVDQANALIARGERFHEPEVRRLEGELVMAESGDREQAETSLRAAADCARRQGARTLELRAVTSLARLVAGDEQARQARERLAVLLAGFDEGFGTPDLDEARRLVEERRALPSPSAGRRSDPAAAR
jgi:tetratricopeptide (TPR) repeat protein